MPITDLTGYTWTGNNVLNPSVDFSSALINFTSSGNNYTAILYETQEQVLYYNRTEAWSGFWTDPEYNTIQIMGGRDVTDPYLIAWLQANGTLTPPAPAANTYSITHTLSNLTKGNITFTITPDTGYSLPASSSDITVTNGTIVSYNNQTGVLVINGDDTTTISCECPTDPNSCRITVNITLPSASTVSWRDIEHAPDIWNAFNNGITFTTLTETINVPVTNDLRIHLDYYADSGTSIVTGGVSQSSSNWGLSGSHDYTVSGNGTITINITGWD